MNIQREIEENIKKLSNVFKSSINNFFFTEKELHSYFYHLCISNPLFKYDKQFNLIHTEYPSPFKCIILKDEPYIDIDGIESKQQRSHIDFVIFNPDFIEWIMNNHKNDWINPVIGIGKNRFDGYMKDFYKIYQNFNRETNETILLYALEFKFLRHSFVGTKYPIKSIKQDIQKLRLLKSIKYADCKKEIKFVAKTNSLIFIGDNNIKLKNMLIEEIKNSKKEFKIISR